MPADFETGERYIRQMHAGQRHDVFAPASYDLHPNARRRAVIEAEMSEGIAYAQYFKREQPTSTAAAARLIRYYRRHIQLMILLRTLA
ncbi:hypothetical protein R3P38DRAFT_3173020 [Favolaschia claudopus]|uniref:Uncharacterized protein n=1 Tax=Favolaschia claudopus TaxID=2862362 RepID=A0AAW0DQW4_9AGAR